AVPPRQLETSAIATPIHSVTWCSLLSLHTIVSMEVEATNSGVCVSRKHRFSWQQMSAEETPSLRGAKRRSNPACLHEREAGLLRFARTDGRRHTSPFPRRGCA